MTERNEKIIQFRFSGLTLQEVGSLLGVSRQRVHQVLVKYGITQKSVAELRQKLKQEKMERALLGIELPSLAELEISPRIYSHYDEEREDRYDQVQKLKKSGLTSQQVAKELNVAVSVVNQLW